MNKSELIESLAAQRNLSFKKAEEVISTIFDSLTGAMKTGERIEIRGFGSFVIKDYRPYTGRNPKTGAPIQVRPKKLPFFKVGKEIKERITVG
jgi:integration host factor subunit beta